MKRSAKLRPQMIGSATASTAQTAKSLLRWLRRVDRQVAAELAAEHASGAMSDSDVIRYIENEAHELLPDGFRPVPEGTASVVFADWCSASDHDERVLADPAVGQYREAYLVLHALRGDKRVGRVPFIWVDSELSLLRGQIQGFPKKMGQIAMTKPVELGKGGVRHIIGVAD